MTQTAARAKIVAQILTDSGQPVSSPDEGTLDDVEWERWNVCLQIAQALDETKPSTPIADVVIPLTWHEREGDWFLKAATLASLGVVYNDNDGYLWRAHSHHEAIKHDTYNHPTREQAQAALINAVINALNPPPGIPS